MWDDYFERGDWFKGFILETYGRVPIPKNNSRITIFAFQATYGDESMTNAKEKIKDQFDVNLI